MRRILPLAIPIVVLSAGFLFLTTKIESQSGSSSDFVHYESGHVHPAVLSPGQNRLFVVNTPDMRLSVFSLSGGLPVLEKEIYVGLEPVSVAAYNEDTVWVANHLSDDISIVDVNAGNVVRTLRVGDEPTDILFAGTGNNRRAFVCVSQEDAIKIYDPANLDSPPDSIAIPGSDPRALASNGDGTEVYVTVLESGSQTTIVHFQEVLAGGGLPAPSPPMSGGLPSAPNVGLIVKWDGTAWRDEIARDWNFVTPHRLADKDLIILDANARSISGSALGVGTINFNAAWNPGNGQVYVTNQDAQNHVRFEPNLKGSFQRNRVTIVDPSSAIVTNEVHLNPHINYSVVPGSQTEIDQSLAMPTDIAFNSTGTKGYIAAFGSNLIAVINSSGTVTNRIQVGGGPSGVVVDESRNFLYVVNRFDNTVSVVNTLTETEVSVVGIGKSDFDPTPEDIKDGRRLLYDARLTSGHGDVSCSSCHVFGNFDAVAWDLGDPQGNYVGTGDPEFPPGQLDPLLEGFHPMKGPMSTQTLRGLKDLEPFHWRGDRLHLDRFNPAFMSLLGNDRELTNQEMDDFEAFVMSICLPPNPNQNLDRSFPDPVSGPSAFRGLLTFIMDAHDGGLTCEQCHSLPTGTSGLLVNDQALQEDQDLKIPHLRNLYEKVGYADDAVTDNKLGFGFTHDGVSDNLFNFVSLPVFEFTDDGQRRDMEAYLLAFDTGTPPIIGYQVTVTGSNKNDAEIIAATALLVARAANAETEIIVKGMVDGQQRGYAMDSFGTFLSDRPSEGGRTVEQMRLLATDGGELTWTAVPNGTALRAGLDRDRDGFWDRDELDQGSDPADPDSYPGAVSVPAGPAIALHFSGATPNPFRNSTQLKFSLPRRGHLSLTIYDPRGRVVRVLADGIYPSGRHQLAFDGLDSRGARLGVGIYFAKLDFEGVSEKKRVVLLR